MMRRLLLQSYGALDGDMEEAARREYTLEPDKLKGEFLLLSTGKSSTEPKKVSRVLCALAVTVLPAILVLGSLSLILSCFVSPAILLPAGVVSELHIVGPAWPNLDHFVYNRLFPSRTGADLASTLTSEYSIVGDMCGMLDSEAATALSLPHGWLKGEPRYFYHGSWVSMQDLYLVVEAQRREMNGSHVEEENILVECLLLAVTGQIPCLHQKCVISLRMRPAYSDFSVLKQHLEEESYGFISKIRPGTVLDAGANVGYSTLLFGVFFPQAIVVAVEPSPLNFAILKANTQHLPNIIAVQGCLYNAPRSMLLVSGKAIRPGWQYEVADPDTAENGAEAGIVLQCLTVGQLALKAGIHGFEYVKMDIEGSERAVMATAEGYDPVDWLQHVKLFSIESHEKTKPKCNAAIRDALKRSGGWKRKGKSGEYKIFQRS